LPVSGEDSWNLAIASTSQKVFRVSIRMRTPGPGGGWRKHLPLMSSGLKTVPKNVAASREILHLCGLAVPDSTDLPILGLIYKKGQRT